MEKYYFEWIEASKTVTSYSNELEIYKNLLGKCCY